MRQIVSVRDAAELEDFLASRGADAAEAAAFARLVQLPGARELIDEARRVFVNHRSSDALDALDDLWRTVERAGLSDDFEIDLGDVSGLDYYTGLTFKIYVAGAGARVGGGGRYDGLTASFGRAEPAVGFVLDLDALTETLLRAGANELPQTIERETSRLGAGDAGVLTIALAKGRMQQDALALLARAGVRVSDEAINSRRLAVEDEGGRFRFIFVKPSDVPVYVEHGVADCGVVGRDVLLEADADLLQPLDLGIGRCRLVVAAPPGRVSAELVAPRVATKYPRIAAAHFGARGTPVEIIALSGSVELAPLMGLADCIVDLVETGRTLSENGLEAVETIALSSARLVVNRASYQLKAGAVAALIDSLRRVVDHTEDRAEVAVSD
jgi:ATP phosphoribosyltransferase